MKIVKAENVTQVNEAVCRELKDRLADAYSKSFPILVDSLQAKVGTKVYNEKYCTDFKGCCEVGLKRVFENIDTNLELMCTTHGIGYHDAMELILEFMYDRLQEAKEAQVTLDSFKDDEQVGFA